MILKPIEENEFAPYYKHYIDTAPDIDIIKSLSKSKKDVLSLLENLTPEKWDYKYAKDKWTIKELVLHIIDTERIMAYRALRIARKDSTALAGFDENEYVPFSKANERSAESLIQEYKMQRQSTLCLYENLPQESLKNIGIASNCNASVRALGYIISGHEIHHLNVLNERYL